MTRCSRNQVLGIVTLLSVLCSGIANGQTNPLSWEELPPIPDALGFAGPFAGVHNDVLIVAGGANFPRPVWENDKVWHDRIFVLTKKADHYEWNDGGKLRRPLAYGSAVSTTEGVLCMGGNDATTVTDEVFLLSWDSTSGTIQSEKYPSLPRPCAFGAATIVDDVVYLAGGQSGMTLKSAMTNFWSLDLTKRHQEDGFVWNELPSWPGDSRALNLTVHQQNATGDAIYVISGRRQESETVEFLRDVWEYNPATGKWRARQDAPRCVMAGTASGWGKNAIYVLGGATERLFFKTDELKDDHPGFIRQSLIYNTQTDMWAEAGTMPQNHVTTIAVEWDDAIIVPTGEVRPRVRTPKVYRVKPNR